jgi:hypothetical protein
MLISFWSINKHGCHRQFLFYISRFLKIFFSETALSKWTDIWWEAPMEGSVLSFLKAEWKVSDTCSAQCWASSFASQHSWFTRACCAVSNSYHHSLIILYCIQAIGLDSKLYRLILSYIWSPLLIKCTRAIMTAKQNTDRSACRFVVLVYMTITETAQVQINNVVTLKILQQYHGLDDH